MYPTLISNTYIQHRLAYSHGSEAVFLDNWVVPDWMTGRSLQELRQTLADEYNDEGELWWALYCQVQPSYMLYCVGADGLRVNISDVHQTPCRDADGDYAAEVPSLREMIHEELRDGFSSTMEDDHDGDRPKHELVQVSPQGGTLVVFDSAVVLHEVVEVVEGDRLALFGFFADERPAPPAWADPEGVNSACGPWFHDGWAHLDDGRG